ncbi:MAG: hypothetical protein SVM79_09445, partial [Chloroflexota bacterium]|nr:hypothetical protein [Chloroflexota bacterium]
VATLSHAHFLDLDQFTPEMIVDNMLASQEWMRTVHQKNPTAKWPIFIWNHLPPSGASIVHPHVQALVREMSTAMQEQLLARSKVYFAKKGHSFWQELVETERELGQRYIGHNDSLSVIAGFAPRGFREIHFIFDDTSSFTHLDENQIRDFADAIIKVLRGYKSMGVGSFNLNVFSGPIDENSEHYLLNAKMISRPFPQGVYSSDTGPFERLQDEWVIEFLPEDVAQRMRAVWACS